MLKTILFTATFVLLLQSPASALQSSLADYGTIADEKAAYQKWGWAWSASQEPSIPTGARPIGTIDVHSALEVDDLWQNIVMWKRTGNQGYYDLAASWAQYYKNTYRSDYRADLDAFFGDHTFGWGLVEWARITGDNTYLDTANAIGDALQTAWYASFGESVKAGFYGLRGPGRHLKLAVALGRTQWANDIWAKLRDSFRWDERTIGGTNIGFWKEDASAFPWAVGASGAISSFSFAVLNEGLADYYDLTGDAEVKRRMILMAQFANRNGLDSSVNHTGHWIMIDYPAKDAFFHTGLGQNLPLDPFYTCTFVNVLVRGSLLSGDTAMLDRAKYTWDRCSKAVADDTYPYLKRTPDNQVGHFMNSQMLSGGIFYLSDGELPYVDLLFKAVSGTVTSNTGNSTPSPTDNWKVLPNSSLGAVVANTSYIVSPGADGWSYPRDNIVKDWNGGIIDTKRKMLILPTPGGHNSWFYNDVWGYDLVNFRWLNLRKAYVPYITQAEADRTGKLVYDDGSPSTVHTYDGISYLDNLDEVFMIGGPGWNSTGQGPPPRRFSMTTGAWSYGTSQGIYPENGTCSAVNPADGTVWFRTSTKLYSYDIPSNKYTLLSDNLASPETYYTALVVDGVFYMFGGGGVIKVVPGQQALRLTLSGDPLPNVPAPGVAWEPAIQRVILWGGGGDVYFVNLATLNVSKKQVAGEAPGPSQGLGTYKRFGRYGHGQYALVNSIDAVYSLTLDVGAPPPASTTVPPPPPPASTTVPPPPPPASTTVPPPPPPPPATSSSTPSTPSPSPPAGPDATTLSVGPVTIEAENMQTNTTGGAVDGGWSIWSDGYIEATVNFASTGQYRFVIYARGQSAMGVAPDMELRIDQQAVNKMPVPAATWTPYTVDVNVAAGIHEVAIAFTNDFFGGGEDRNLLVDKFSIEQTSATTTPVAPPANRPPSVDAGPYRRIRLSEPVVTLNATVTDDGLPSNNLRLLWTVVPANGVRLEGITSLTPVVAFESEGIYKLTLTAGDGELASSDEVTIEVLLAQPEVVVGPRSGEVLLGRPTPIITNLTQSNITKVEIWIDGEVKASGTSLSLRYLWDPRALGMHTVEVFAFDGPSVVASFNQMVRVK